jgi:hypothetical protein
MSPLTFKWYLKKVTQRTIKKNQSKLRRKLRKKYQVKVVKHPQLARRLLKRSKIKSLICNPFLDFKYKDGFIEFFLIENVRIIRYFIITIKDR